MNIKFVPKDKSHPANRRASTNIGDFLPGEVRGISESQEQEAHRLIANGDFVESDEAPNSTEIAAGVGKKAAAQKAKSEKAEEKAAPAKADTHASDTKKK